MPISSARSTAYRILCRVESSGALAVDLLQNEQVSSLQEVDRGLATELVMGVLRWRGELDFKIEMLSGKRLRVFDPEIVTVLRLALYQIGFLERIPVSAAVNEAVEMVKAARKRSAAGLVNAVLRKAGRVGQRPSRRGAQEDSGLGSRDSGLAEQPEFGIRGSGLAEGETRNSKLETRLDSKVESRRGASGEAVPTPVSSRVSSFALSAPRIPNPEPRIPLLEGACRATPNWLLDRWTRHFGSDAAKGLALASVSVPPTVLRVTGGEPSLEAIGRELGGEGIVVHRTRFARDALMVVSGRVQASRAWREGRVVIQDEASQLVATLLRVEPGQRVLDVAAAPGIKTAQLAAMLGGRASGHCGLPIGDCRSERESGVGEEEDSATSADPLPSPASSVSWLPRPASSDSRLPTPDSRFNQHSAIGNGWLVACDVSARRLADLPRLLPRQVPPGVNLSLVRLDATRPLPFLSRFERILLDAPCSGTGTLARNPEIKWRLRLDDLARLAERQRAMLRRALKVLAPGGRVVYATCSLEPEENERVVEAVVRETTGIRALSRDEVLLDVPNVAGLIDEDGYFRTRPDLHAMDGFFGAVLENCRLTIAD